jgi:FixJ family two-component response regulator
VSALTQTNLKQEDPAGDNVVIVVDDDLALLGALKFAFELEGYAVKTYADAESVLAAGELPQTGCLIVDQVLDGVSGLGLLEALRGRGVDLPAVLITTHPTEALRTQAKAANVPIIEKPLLQDDLTDKVAQLLGDGKA